jgi:hypothetical protein
MKPAIALIVLVFVLSTLAPAFSQTAFTLPSWLANYPGTNPKVYSSDSFAQTSYVVDAQPAEVVEHYRKLFEAQGLEFQPNPDGMGTTIRVAAKECDLFIQIRRREEGTFTKVTCSGKIDPSSIHASETPNIEMVTGITPPPPPESTAAKADGKQENSPSSPIQNSKGSHNVPAPALLWPDWLTDLSGSELSPVLMADSTGSPFLNATYVTTRPLNAIFSYYRKLLQDHDYRPNSAAAAGRTAAGFQQNATGTMRGVHYEKGAAGPNTTIDISNGRDGLKGPITVTVRFSPHGLGQGEHKSNPAGTQANKAR